MDALRNAPRLFFALAFLVALGCTSSPTEPKGSTGGTPQTPKPPPPSVSFTVTVTANPSDITAGSTGSSNIVVNVVRSDGQVPADGSVVHVTTTLGVFGSTGGTNAVDLQLVNGRAAATLFALTETGTAAITATFSGFSGAANVRIGQAATFFVSSVSPSVGNPSGGETVTILGGGFVAPVRVTFNGAAATVKSATGNSITVVTPSAAAAGVTVGVGQTAPVTVAVTINVNKVNQAVDSIAQGFTYALGGGTQQPAVFTVTPSLGTNDGGTLVTIVGDGFVAPVQVLFGIGGSSSSFNGVEATVQSVSTNRIVAITPAATGFGQNLSNQVVSLLIKNVNSGFSTIAAQAFKYGSNVQITSMTQGTGSYLGGTRTSIQGSGFNDPVAVSFAFGGIGIAQQAVSVTGTQVVILTSPAPLSGTCPKNGLITSTAVSVTNIDNGDTATAPIGFNFQVPLPQIGGINPPSGGTGTSVTITGSGFSTLPNNVQVLFGDPATGSTALNVHVVSDTVITATVPNKPQGFAFNTIPCPTGSTGTINVATPINVTAQNVDTTCLATFRGFNFVPTGTDATNNCVTTPPPPPPAPTASFTSQALGAPPHTMQFIDTSTGSPTSWAWTFFGTPGPITSSAQNPVVTFPAAGSYNVKLTITAAGGTATTTQSVTVP
jgi:hypothetical protein